MTPLQTEDIARQLAARPYHFTLTKEELAEGEVAFAAAVIELPHCIGQGSTPQEALDDLHEVVFEYILGFLEDGIEVPDPYSFTTHTANERTLRHLSISLPFPGALQKLQQSGIALRTSGAETKFTDTHEIAFRELGELIKHNA